MNFDKLSNFFKKINIKNNKDMILETERENISNIDIYQKYRDILDIQFWKWINYENFGKIEKIKKNDNIISEDGVDYIIFESGNRINVNLIKEFLQPISTEEYQYLFEANKEISNSKFQINNQENIKFQKENLIITQETKKETKNTEISNSSITKNLIKNIKPKKHLLEEKLELFLPSKEAILFLEDNFVLNKEELEEILKTIIETELKKLVQNFYKKIYENE
jgi:ribosomal protein L21